MPDVKNNIIWTLRDEVSATAVKMNRSLDTVGVKAKGATGILGQLGPATGGLVTPMTLGAGAALALAGGVVAAGKAAIEEEKNIGRLDAALEANIAAWDGNTDAIEGVIAQREKLAFTDDEQRESLALLVAATEDVTEAQKVQATAMDLARFKGISLKEASEALVKVEAGQYRILKSLGIVLRDGATQTEALAAVQKVAGGQAEKYGESTAGAMESAQIAIDDVVEDVGAELLPVMKELAEFTRDDLVPAVRSLSGALAVLDADIGPTDVSANDLLGTFREMANPILDVSGHLERAADILDGFGVNTDAARKQFRDFGLDVEDGADHSADAIEALRASAGPDLHQVEEDEDDVGEAADGMASATQAAADWMKQTYRDLRDVLSDETEALIDDVFDPIETRLERQQNHFEITNAIAARESAKGREAIVNANADIVEALDDQAQTLAELGEQGQLTGGDVDRFVTDIEAAYKAMGKTVPPEVQKVITKLRELAKFDGKNINVDVYTRWKNTYGKTGKGPQEFGDGGWVDAPPGQPVPAIVHGGEYVMSAEELAAMRTGSSFSGGGWSPMAAPTAPVIHLRLYLDGREIAAAVEAASYYEAAMASTATGPV